MQDFPAKHDDTRCGDTVKRLKPWLFLPDVGLSDTRASIEPLRHGPMVSKTPGRKKPRQRRPCLVKNGRTGFPGHLVGGWGRATPS